jgi:hypothetical protein
MLACNTGSQKETRNSYIHGENNDRIGLETIPQVETVLVTRGNGTTVTGKVLNWLTERVNSVPPSEGGQSITLDKQQRQLHLFACMCYNKTKSNGSIVLDCRR